MRLPTRPDRTSGYRQDQGQQARGCARSNQLPRSEIDGCRSGKLKLSTKTSKSAKARRATAKFDIKGGASKKVKLKLKGKLRHARHAQLSASALDGAGNVGKTQRSVKLVRTVL